MAAEWKARGWRTAAREPVKNQDLWELLDAAAAEQDIEWHWVKGIRDMKAMNTSISSPTSPSTACWRQRLDH